eukprot:4613674-Karenia_brevis.AAC.1
MPWRIRRMRRAQVEGELQVALVDSDHGFTQNENEFNPIASSTEMLAAAVEDVDRTSQAHH